MKNIYLWLMGYLLILLMPEAKALTAYRYDLDETNLISKTCMNDGVKVRSKMKLIFDHQIQGQNYRNLKIKTWLCTKGYGFRIVKLWLNLPKEVSNKNYFPSMNVGNDIVFHNIPSTKVSGKLLNILVKRNSITQFQISWPSRPSGNDEYMPVNITAVDPRTLSSIQGFNENYHLAWQKVVIPYKHPRLSEPFVLAGQLEGVEEEQ